MSIVKFFSVFSAAGITMVAGIVSFNQTAQAEVLLRAQARCSLREGSYELFNGYCNFKHKRNNQRDLFQVSLDNGQDFNISGSSVNDLGIQTNTGFHGVRLNEGGASQFCSK